MVNNNNFSTINNSFRLSHLIIRLKYDWCLGMARSWLRCFLVLFFISSLIFIYATLNVPSVDIKSTNTLTSMITPKFEITNKLTFNVQDNSLKYFNYQEKCSIIHIAMVCSGYNSTQSLITVVKSILFYRSKPLHFHFIIDHIANRTLKILFDTWNLPQVNVSFYSDNIWIPKVSWIPNKHYSGVYGLLKLILPEILTDINRVLVLDTDVTVLTDLTNLWNNFDDFNNYEMLGLVENQSDWYKKILGNGINPWPAIGNGFNTGVILMDLKRLRERNFFNLWMKTCENVLKKYYEVSLADQDIINAVIKEEPSIVFTLDCTWNVQLSDRTMSDQCYHNAKQIQVRP
ncbi:hypothetical protein PV327_001542 [Microctonus hyperodae]|uniref:Uncharacterized protein n=1 Tax=Microctonus hyperodae TaxID=165561 RepID=A0AA39L3B4_MICHY|nr:hypothetical protein PV327_001542 [Microctonus hyperodae]